MAKTIFTTSESSAYDDQPEERYHFPKTYLRQATEAIGDWILYYEPRRTSGKASSTGRQAYFAMAKLESIDPDPRRSNHFYAYVSEYVELDNAVPFRERERYMESSLKKADGSTNKGAFGRAVRAIPDDEFTAIVALGFTRALQGWENASSIADPVPDSDYVEGLVPECVERPTITQIVSRKFRDEAFRRHVRSAYANTCAVTGLRLINGGGRPEVQAAHIRPVEMNGPDTVRNGVALTGTVHWLFDRGLISVDDSWRVLLSPQGLPDGLGKLIKHGRQLKLPERPELKPHPTYLAWHREHRFKR